jgi:hypothetical protein
MTGSCDRSSLSTPDARLCANTETRLLTAGHVRLALSTSPEPSHSHTERRIGQGPVPVLPTTYVSLHTLLKIGSSYVFSVFRKDFFKSLPRQNSTSTPHLPYSRWIPDQFKYGLKNLWSTNELTRRTTFWTAHLVSLMYTYLFNALFPIHVIYILYS